MFMKPGVITLLVAVALSCCTATFAGSVDIGYVDDAGLDRWLAGGPAKVPSREVACKPVKVPRIFIVRESGDFQPFLANDNVHDHTGR
jgi:hypothetical protein